MLGRKEWKMKCDLLGRGEQNHLTTKYAYEEITPRSFPDNGLYFELDFMIFCQCLLEMEL